MSTNAVAIHSRKKYPVLVSSDPFLRETYRWQLYHNYEKNIIHHMDYHSPISVVSSIIWLKVHFALKHATLYTELLEASIVYLLSEKHQMTYTELLY